MTWNHLDVHEDYISEINKDSPRFGISSLIMDDTAKGGLTQF